MTRIALVQQRITPDRKANVERGTRALESAARQGVQLVCYPELSVEPFYPQRRAEPGFEALAEPVPDPTTGAFASLARKLCVVVVLTCLSGTAGAGTTPRR